jgi:alkanesulfonate monooxygenase SsuD/methylene tetrahydromethanopterin reductase-like flavin-dependent oxidoreductase (luciferase family)
MKLSMPLMYDGNPRVAADSVADLEGAGLDTVWVAEAYGFDSPTLMGYLAAKTETIEIGSAILNVFSRTPALIAQTAAGLDNVSGGRAILGLGASGPQVIEGWHGMPYTKPLGRTREVVDLVRRALRREPLTNDGNIAALGKKSVASAAEYADGWLPMFYAPELAPTVWGPSLQAGKAKRSPDLGPLEVAAGGMVAVGEDVKGMLDLARPLFALYIGGMGAKGKNFYNDLVTEYGFEAEAAKVQDLYLAGSKREAESAVPVDLLEMCNLVGPESYVRERIAAFAESGVTSLQVTPVDEDPAGLVRRLKEWVSA